MKRSLLLVPVILLAILNACVVNPSQAQLQVAVVQTLTALSWTPTFTPSPSPIPNGQWLVVSLNQVGSEYTGLGNDFMYTGAGGVATNTGLAEKLDQLEDVIGSDFIIMDVQFPMLPNTASVAFQVHARCECATNGQCCTPEHMFVLTVRKLYIAMQQYQEQFYLSAGQVPTPVEQLQVVAYDHQHVMATMVAPWTAVLSFIRGQINGYQLGMQVHRQQ